MMKKISQQNDIDEDDENSQSNLEPKESDIDEDSVVNVTPATSKRNAEQILNEFETDQTKLMSLEQLQRFLVLQQLQVVALQRKRLEQLNGIDNEKTVTFDFIGFEDETDGVNLTNAKN